MLHDLIKFEIFFVQVILLDAFVLIVVFLTLRDEIFESHHFLAGSADSKLGVGEHAFEGGSDDWIDCRICFLSKRVSF